jgi:peptide chain release factor 1
VPTRAPRVETGFDVEIVEEYAGFACVQATGAGAKRLYKDEAGGHRWQRIPPTEKRGRVHSSTITVAVLDPDAPVGARLDLRDVEVTTTRGSGPGGQNRNKVESCVIATHRPSGLSVRIDNERSQHQNKALAYQVLAARLYQAASEGAKAERDRLRHDQVGSGQRGDAVRTYREQDDQVIDRRTGKKASLKKWRKGEW